MAGGASAPHEDPAACEWDTYTKEVPDWILAVIVALATGCCCLLWSFAPLPFLFP